MRCTIIENYFKENSCYETIVPGEIQEHLTQCKYCRNYYQLVSTLKIQKGSLEKAPKEILQTIERKILDSVQIEHKEPFILTSLLKPSFAGFFVILVCVVAYTYLANKNVGCVENLSKRFKLTRFENIKADDMLYAGDNTTAVICLKSKNKVQIHKNTIVKVNGSRYLSLSRGAISLQAGDKELQIATPDGLLLARNTNARIQTIARLENGVLKTETTCMVFKGQLSIKSSLKETTLHQGQKTIIIENGLTSDPQQLTIAEVASEENIAEEHAIYTAVESLCDCIYSFNYGPGKKTDHLQLFGKEVNENKFKVHVFWQAKGLNGLISEPSNKNDNICSIKTRRIRV